MRVTFLGTADAFGGAGRANAALLVEDRRGRVLVDCGPGILSSLARHGVAPGSIDAVVLTHLHGDHFAGVPFLLLDGLHGSGRTTPLVIAGPQHTAGRVEALFRILYGNAAARRRPFLVDYRELEPGHAIDLAGRRVVAGPALHMSGGETALSLRLESDGRVLAVSGDTAAGDHLPAVARDADLFVCECSLAAPNPAQKHLSVEELARLAPSWSARRTLLTHLSAEARALAATLPDLSVADDGLTVDLGEVSPGR